MDRIARRDLLRGGAVVVALATMPLKLREAVGAPPLPPPRNLIVVLNSGGWDTTYTFDPKPGLKTVDAPAGKEQAFGGLRVFVDPSRPNVSDFFTRYGSIAAVVNGVQLLSFIHPDCTKRILTGAPSDVKPDVGAIAANDLGRDLPVPYLVLGNSAISGPLAAITGRAGTTNQIAALISPELAYGSVDTPYVPAPGLVCTAKENDFVRRYLEATSARLRATRGQHGANARQVDDFLKSLTRSDQLRAFAKSTPEGFGKRAYTPDLDVQVQIATKAMQSGLCHSVMLEMGNWDTHENNAQQGGYQNKLFGSMTRLAGELEKLDLLRHTVVVVLSEMGRTPKLNAAKGKDHWPVTSALVFGAGVAGKRTLGATDDQLGARSIDLSTGAPVENGGKQVQTANLLAGVLSLVGIDPARHFPGVDPLDALRG